MSFRCYQAPTVPKAAACSNLDTQPGEKTLGGLEGGRAGRAGGGSATGGWGFPRGMIGGGGIRHLQTVGYAAITPTFLGVPTVGIDQSGSNSAYYALLLKSPIS